jgi:hypothetical protein
MKKSTYCLITYHGFTLFKDSLDSLKKATNIYSVYYDSNTVVGEEVHTWMVESEYYRYINCYHRLLQAVKEFIRTNELSIPDSFRCLSQNVDIKDINEVKNWIKIQYDFEAWFKKWIKNSERKLSDVEFFIEQATNIYEYIKAKIEAKELIKKMELNI